jgi:hypothetical protein
MPPPAGVAFTATVALRFSVSGSAIAPSPPCGRDCAARAARERDEKKPTRDEP